jgi:hypothetical protein
MARTLQRLAPGKVAKANGTAGKTTLLPDGGGLYLRIGPTGAKSWVLRYMLAGKAREMGLGSVALVGLREAREKALTQRRMARLDGVDPVEARRADRLAAKLASATAMTFEDCAKAYIDVPRAGWRNAKHAVQWPTTLSTYAYPIFGSLPVAAIDTGLVMKAIEPIWSTRPETASRVRGRIESVLDWARARGYRDGENPARWKGHLDNLLPRVSKAKRAARAQNGRGEHHAALPYADLPALRSSPAARGRSAIPRIRHFDGGAHRRSDRRRVAGNRRGRSPVVHSRWAADCTKAPAAFAAGALVRPSIEGQDPVNIRIIAPAKLALSSSSAAPTARNPITTRIADADAIASDRMPSTIAAKPIRTAAPLAASGPS